MTERFIQSTFRDPSNGPHVPAAVRFWIAFGCSVVSAMFFSKLVRVMVPMDFTVDAAITLGVFIQETVGDGEVRLISWLLGWVHSTTGIAYRLPSHSMKKPTLGQNGRFRPLVSVRRAQPQKAPSI